MAATPKATDDSYEEREKRKRYWTVCLWSYIRPHSISAECRITVECRHGLQKHWGVFCSAEDDCLHGKPRLPVGICILIEYGFSYHFRNYALWEGRSSKRLKQWWRCLLKRCDSCPKYECLQIASCATLHNVCERNQDFVDQPPRYRWCRGTWIPASSIRETLKDFIALA